MNTAKYAKDENTRRSKMTGMSQNEEERLERHVRPWLERTRTSIERYRILLPYFKRLLHNQVCRCTRNLPSSDRELRNLYQRLHSGESRGSIVSPNAVDSVTNRELQEFFSPLSSSETLADLYKY